MVPHIRRATVADTDTIVRVLVASKEASFADSVDDHDRDVGFWTRRWRGYIASGSHARHSRGDGWVFVAEVENVPIGFIAYHHTTRHGTDAELQNIYVLKEWQGRGIGTRLLGTIAHRLEADGSRSMCVGYDSDSPYKRFYMKYGAVEMEPGAPWAIWRDLQALTARVPRPPETLMSGLHERPKSWFRRLWHVSV
jgi:GNAT superfamily N-acetyltransferase